MLTIDCKDVSSVQNELLVYVADKVEAIPTLKHHQFTLSNLDDDDILDVELVISAIKEYFDSINQGSNFAVISKGDIISIESISGKTIERDAKSSEGLFSCPHCGHVTPYETIHNTHMKIHYL